MSNEPSPARLDEPRRMSCDDDHCWACGNSYPVNPNSDHWCHVLGNNF